MLRALAAALALTLGPDALAAGVPRASLQLPRVSASVPVAAAASIRAAAPSAALARSADVLARAEAAGIEAKAVAAEIAGAQDREQALEGLALLEALKIEELPTGPNQTYTLLSRLWDQSSPALIEESFEIDGNWAVPSIKVRQDGVEYHVHALQHGKLIPPDGRRARRLVRQIESRGEALYWEQNLPLHYGSAAGKEINDHDAGTSAVAAASAAGGLTGAEARAARAVKTGALALVPAALAAGSLWLPLPLMLAGLGVAALGGWLLMNGMTPLERDARRMEIAELEAKGEDEAAAHKRREAARLYGRRVDPVQVLRLFLPPGAAAGFDDLAARSQAIADVARADARRAGAKAVHILVGYAHAAHVAWALRDSRPGSAGGETRV